MSHKTVWNVCLLSLLLVVEMPQSAPRATIASPQATSPVPAMVDEFCSGCHNHTNKKGGLDLESVRSEEVAQHTDIWEKVVRKLRTRQMPPAGMSRPQERTYEAVVSCLSDSLDAASVAHPNPGR